MLCPGWRASVVVGVGLMWLAGVGEARAGEVFDPMSDGSDGALVVNEDTVINLALAPTGSWMDPAPEPGLGVYDPSIWAVVFKYESVDVGNVILDFDPHPSGAPVAWLVQGEVNVVAGALIRLNGQSGNGGAPSTYAAPGPGGFAGGRDSSAGFGPGGGSFAQGGHYGSGGRAYGSPELVPLIGGSGGGGSNGNNRPGGAGGGAMLIAADIINMHGILTALGGNGSSSFGSPDGGGGSGGGLRLVANTVVVSAGNALNVSAGGGDNPGTPGRIRIEGFNLNINSAAPVPNTFPHYTTARPGPLFQDETTPYLRVASLNGVPVSDDPLGGVQSIDVGINDTDSTLTLGIEAFNVEPGSIIEVKIFQAQGNPLVFHSEPLAGNIVFSTATAEIMLNSGIPGDIVLRVLP